MPLLQWFDDGQGDCRRKRSVDRIAAALKHCDSGLHRERLRRGYRVPGKNRLTA